MSANKDQYIEPVTQRIMDAITQQKINLDVFQDLEEKDLTKFLKDIGISEKISWEQFTEIRNTVLKENVNPWIMAEMRSTPENTKKTENALSISRKRKQKKAPPSVLQQSIEDSKKLLSAIGDQHQTTIKRNPSDVDIHNHLNVFARLVNNIANAVKTEKQARDFHTIIKDLNDLIKGKNTNAEEVLDHIGDSYLKISELIPLKIFSIDKNENDLVEKAIKFHQYREDYQYEIELLKSTIQDLAWQKNSILTSDLRQNLSSAGQGLLNDIQKEAKRVTQLYLEGTIDDFPSAMEPLIKQTKQGTETIKAVFKSTPQDCLKSLIEIHSQIPHNKTRTRTESWGLIMLCIPLLPVIAVTFVTFGALTGGLTLILPALVTAFTLINAVILPTIAAPIAMLGMGAEKLFREYLPSSVKHSFHLYNLCTSAVSDYFLNAMPSITHFYSGLGTSLTKDPSPQQQSINRTQSFRESLQETKSPTQTPDEHIKPRP
jgi:hypothetical protein